MKKLPKNITIGYVLALLILPITLIISIDGIMFGSASTSIESIVTLFTIIPLIILFLFIDRYFVKTVGRDKVNRFELIILGVIIFNHIINLFIMSIEWF